RRPELGRRYFLARCVFFSGGPNRWTTEGQIGMIESALMERRRTRRPPRGRAIARAGAVCALALLATTAVASAAPLKWSPARSIDTSMGQSLVQGGCPTATECTTLD